MDYSAISDDPTGTSPWASPGPAKTTFSESNNSDIPPSALPPQQQSPYDADRDLSQAASAEPWSASRGEDHDSDLSERLQSAQLGDPDYAVEQPPYATQQPPLPPQQPQYAPQQQGQPPVKPQAPEGQENKRLAPLYRIQARITGLERTGKKDPILRFDVHVGNLYNYFGDVHLTRDLDKYSQIPNYAIPRCPPYPRRIRPARGAFDVGQR